MSRVPDGLNENTDSDDCMGFVFDSWIPRSGRRKGGGRNILKETDLATQ